MVFAPIASWGNVKEIKQTTSCVLNMKVVRLNVTVVFYSALLYAHIHIPGYSVLWVITSLAKTGVGR